MELRKHSQTSPMLRVILRDDTTGLPKPSLTFSSAGLIIATITDNEPTATVYTQASSNIETISTLGTYAAPTTNKCRFKEVHATNFPGMYEIQLANARMSFASAKFLYVGWTGVSGLLGDAVKLELTGFDPFATIGSAVQMKRSTQYDNWHFQMEQTDGTAATGKTVSATRVIDSGSYAACANSVVEVSVGTYRITFASTDLAGQDIMFRFTATGCKDRFQKVVTQV